MLQEPKYVKESKEKGLLDAEVETGIRLLEVSKKISEETKKENNYGDRYKGKDILVTGGCGMIGSALVEKLIELGAHVTVYDNFYSEKLGKTNKKYIKAQILDVDMKENFVFHKQFDIIFHLAAIIGGAGFVTKHSADTMLENSLMTINLYRAIHDQKPRTWPHIVMFSSSTVFENVSHITEKLLPDLAPPRMDYAFQKLFNERMATSQYKQYRIPYTIIRPFNVYGPGELSTHEHGISHVIPDFHRRLSEMLGDEDFEMYGDGHQMRAYTYIDDLIHGVLLAAKFEQSDFNIATAPAIEVNRLAEMMMEIMGIKAQIVHKPAPWHDIPKRIPNPSKIASIGWVPHESLKSGLKKTINWLNEQWMEQK